jgi:DNA-binding HxlR family transcriptional regulator
MVRGMADPAPNVLSAQCPTRLVLDLIADKWTALVIYLLAGGTRRYGELQRSIGGISQKMLTQTLRRLEEDGLVTRTVYAEIPPRTEYSLTVLGATLKEPLGALCRWAELHLSEVERFRQSAARRKGLAVAPTPERPMPRPGPVAVPGKTGR